MSVFSATSATYQIESLATQLQKNPAAISELMQSIAKITQEQYASRIENFRKSLSPFHQAVLEASQKTPYAKKDWFRDAHDIIVVQSMQAIVRHENETRRLTGNNSSISEDLIPAAILHDSGYRFLGAGTDAAAAAYQARTGAHWSDESTRRDHSSLSRGFADSLIFKEAGELSEFKGQIEDPSTFLDIIQFHDHPLIKEYDQLPVEGRHLFDADSLFSISLSSFVKDYLSYLNDDKRLKKAYETGLCKVGEFSANSLLSARIARFFSTDSELPKNWDTANYPLNSDFAKFCSTGRCIPPHSQAAKEITNIFFRNLAECCETLNRVTTIADFEAWFSGAVDRQFNLLQKLSNNEGNILRRLNGLNFRNAGVEAQVSDGALRISTSGATNNFSEMLEQRANPNNMSVTNAELPDKLQTGLKLSNVGTSAAVVTRIKDKDYLLLVRRANGTLMLPSSYVDVQAQPDDNLPFSKRLRQSAIDTVKNEVLICRRNPEDTRDIYYAQAITPNLDPSIAGDNTIVGTSREAILSASIFEMEGLAPLAVDLTKHAISKSDPAIKLSRLEDLSFLPALTAEQTVSVNGNNIGEGKFYYLRESQSGQVVYPFRLELGDVSELSLFNAEVSLARGGEPGELIETLDRSGLVLAELDTDSGLMTGETFYLHSGQLIKVAVPKDELRFSEVFSTSNVNCGESLNIPVTNPKIAQGGKADSITLDEYLSTCI